MLELRTHCDHISNDYRYPQYHYVWTYFLKIFSLTLIDTEHSMERKSLTC